MKRSVSMICCLAILVAPVSPAFAQTEFRNALKDKYGYKSVSCFACHTRSADVPAGKEDEYKANKKAFRNAFGEAFAVQLKGTDVTKKLAAVKELETDDPKKVAAKEAATKLFMEALIKVEAEKSPKGPTWGELLKKAKTDAENETLDGVKSDS